MPNLLSFFGEYIFTRNSDFQRGIKGFRGVKRRQLRFIHIFLIILHKYFNNFLWKKSWQILQKVLSYSHNKERERWQQWQ